MLVNVAVVAYVLSSTTVTLSVWLPTKEESDVEIETVLLDIEPKLVPLDTV